MVVNDWESHRKRILERDDHECVFCGMDNDLHSRAFGEGLHIHHIIPRREYGTDNKKNLMTVCTRCHRKIEAISDHLLNERRESGSDYINDRPDKNKITQALNIISNVIFESEMEYKRLNEVREDLLTIVTEWDDE